MKFHLNNLLAAALMFGLSMCVTSCKDDDDEPKSEEQREQEAQEKASNFWSVVGQLVSVDDVTDEYQGKTFEPTYGLPDPTNDVTRIVNTNDMKTAAQRFANLVNAKGIDENTPSYTWSDPEIGSMTYHKGGDASNWATVDVDIKAVQRLQKIIYRTGGEGENGSFKGKAYYRFGDVVSRDVDIKFDQKKNNDGRVTITEYWICVRPAFGPEGKEDSHWVCVNTVSDKNYKYYKASTGAEYWLPTKLGTNKEHMQNFAEMLWAICNPGTWYDNVLKNHKDGTLWGFDGVPFFTDFKGKNLEYHNKDFWKNVQSGWTKAKIAENALNLTNLGELTEVIPLDGIHLLYNGYSWWFTTSWDCELWEAVYTNGSEKKKEELNMHHAEYNEKIEKNMKNLTFDCRSMGHSRENYNDFFGDGIHRWIIRHATGKELATDGKFDKKQPIKGVTEVYRYYRDVVRTTNLDDNPEITDSPKKVETPYVGCIVGDKGNFYASVEDANRNSETPKAMVIYVGGNKRVEHGKSWNGLAIALRDENNGQRMSFADAESDKTICTHNAPAPGYVSSQYRGLSDTEKLASDSHSHHHPAAENVYKPFIIGNSNFSNWFIPSTGQWCLAMEGMGYGQYVFTGEMQFGKKVYKFNEDGDWLTMLRAQGLPMTELQTDYGYMTSTECNNSFNSQTPVSVWQFFWRNNKNTDFSENQKVSESVVRAFVAFKYGNGGTEEFNEPWTSIDNPVAKGTIGKDGYFYRSGYDAFAATGYAPAAYVLYVDQGANKSVKVGDKYYKGYAVALTYRSEPANEFDQTAWAYQKINAANVNTTLTNYVRDSHGMSEWFVPSIQQWKTGMEMAFGARFDDNLSIIEDREGTTWQNYLINTVFTEDGLFWAGFTKPYWTSTEVEGDNTKAYVIDFAPNSRIGFKAVGKTETYLPEVGYIGMRPFIAF